MSQLFFGIEVTRKCNLRCPHCYTASGGAGAHPGADSPTLAKLLAELAAAGIRNVAFSGGEPLLRHDLEELMRLGRQAGLAGFSLVTNGILVTPQRARSLAQAGLRSVQVSIDGVDAHDHCEVRKAKTGDYYRAVRAVRLLRDVGIAVDVASIVSPRNAERAAEMALFCEAIGARSLRYCSFVPTGRAKDAEISARFAMTQEQTDRFITFMQGLDSHPDASIHVIMDHGIGPWKSSGVFHCDAGEKVAYASSEGDLYPCPGVIFDEFRVGNVFQTPVAELLGSDAMHRPRRIGRDTIEGACRSCANAACSGGCRGAAYAATGNPHAAPSSCFFRSSRDTALLSLSSHPKTTQHHT